MRWRAWPFLAALAVALTAGGSAFAQEDARSRIVAAAFAAPTRDYGHDVLGGLPGYRALRITMRAGQGGQGGPSRDVPDGEFIIRLPDTHVFEDIAPRLWDIDGDGDPEVAVVLSSMTRGAALAVFDETGLIDATPHIGRAHRWLAPVGAADLDGDGHVEIAYIDRPHLAKRLRIWRFTDGRLSHVADREGLTNHRIGWPHIPGGIRFCGTVPEAITANAGWTRIVATTLRDGAPQGRDIGPYTGPDSLNAALTCS